MENNTTLQFAFTPSQIGQQVRMRKDLLERMLDMYLSCLPVEEDNTATLEAKMRTVVSFEYYAAELGQIMREYIEELRSQG